MVVAPDGGVLVLAVDPVHDEAAGHAAQAADDPRPEPEPAAPVDNNDITANKKQQRYRNLVAPYVSATLSPCTR